MKNIILCILITLFTVQAKCQNSDKKNKGFWFGTNYIGFATLEYEKTAKLNATVHGVTFVKELPLNHKVHLLTGIEFQRMGFNLPDDGLFTQNQILKIPIYLSYNSVASKNTTLQIQAGFYLGYLLKSTEEALYLNQKNNETGLGFNFGLGTFIGFHHNLTECVGFQLGLVSQGDLFQNYKKEQTTLKITKLHAVQFGISLIL